MNNQASNPNPGAAKQSLLGVAIFLGLFGAVFAGIGLLAVGTSVQLLAAGNTHKGLPLGIVGLIFSLIGFAVLLGLVFIRRKARQQAEAAARNPGQPWMLRSDWAAGKVKSSAPMQTVMLLVMALAFLGIGGISTVTALPKELPKHNYTVLVVLFFPAVGLGFFVAFVRSWMQERRAGKCILELKRVPAPIGGTLAATIQTGTRIKFQHALHLQLSCIRRVVNRGEHSSTSEYVLWQGEKVYRPDASYPETRPGHTGIPVYFRIPPGQPESSSAGNVSITWQLDAKSVMSGANFHAVFEVPVFNVAGTEAGTAEEPDPTAAMQMPIEAMRRDERSLIQVSNGPGGREFYFPRWRNWKKACGATFAMIFCGAMMAVMVSRAPMIVILFIGLFVALTTAGTFDLWFGSIRIAINAGELRRVKRWLFLSRERVYAKNDISEIKADVNNNILLTTTAGRYVTLADGVPDLLEAQWLAREMSTALGHAAAIQAEAGASALANPMPPALLRMMQRPRRRSSFIGPAIFLIVALFMFAPFIRALLHSNQRHAVHGPVPAPITPQTPAAPPSAPSPARVSFETAEFSISGSGFRIQALDLGRKAFQNRKFVWEEIPEEYRGWRYTQVKGGAQPPPQIGVHTTQDTVLRIITSSHDDGVDLQGWDQTNGQFLYNDKKHVPMILLQKKVAAGQTITLPQGDWTGCLLLIPSAAVQGTNVTH